MSLILHLPRLTFNWTKVELKPGGADLSAIAGGAFNWTKVELKLEFNNKIEANTLTFNWTKVELKLTRISNADVCKKLLIELR